MSIEFWTNENMGTFWEYVKMLLGGIAPGIMLTVAVAAAGLLIGIIVNAFKQTSDNKDDDYEIRHY
ncbi:hypothetical protein FH966_14785 [Lentibacillus cibarius]|uniref:Uncharacterized protein n=1 Tax=Lentibacillus cibarius TaxID=2583219 RepID=A0A549YA80_9BACI|nr:hypothetical protein [Lentibacillus cibarius]TRM08766.1 hypothetical protein FH966_16450 [Lentibacillus cibarius]TRM08794.1 hypothetical protein FH966_16600 [Lentibacillus cibarius]TRM12868.1 hypothetical protein FH966_14785 [Lentibacillus cibarius]